MNQNNSGHEVTFKSVLNTTAMIIGYVLIAGFILRLVSRVVKPESASVTSYQAPPKHGAPTKVVLMGNRSWSTQT